MYTITLDDKFSDIGIFQTCARRQYRTQQQIKRTIGGRVELRQIARREEWRLLLGADGMQREIGRVRKVEVVPPAAIITAPQHATFGQVVRMFAAAVVALVGILRP